MPEKVIEFVAETNCHDMHYAEHAWRCGIAEGIAALSHGLVPNRTGPSLRAAQLRATLKEVFAPRGDWGPDVAFDVLRKAVPRNTVITADFGAHRILLSQQWECYRERGLYANLWPVCRQWDVLCRWLSVTSLRRRIRRS